MRCSVGFRIAALLLVVIALTIGGTYAFCHAHYKWVMLSVVFLSYLVYRICYLQQSTTRMFLRMLDEVKYNDNTLHFATERKGGLERELAEKMNAILEDIKQSSFAKAEQSTYYETLMNIIDSCLIVVDSEDKIYWMNQQAELQLCGYALHSLEELSSVHEELPELIRTLQPGTLRALRIYHKDTVVDMAVTVTEYQRRGRQFRLVHLRNIRSLLEENEMEAWQKLVRVLTHEIMNSIAPITSLSDTLSEYTEDAAWVTENGGLLQQGLQTIHRRSKGLLEFVENYRKLTRISAPVLAPVAVDDLLSDIQKLCSGYPVSFEWEASSAIVMMDRTQMEQVLINLIKNAYEACAGMAQPRIVVKSVVEADQHLWVLKVEDNGCGILPDVVDKIFVPFFTTKSSGSGIGLSLCKQMVNLHGGRISVKSEVDKGTCFTVKMMA